MQHIILKKHANFYQDWTIVGAITLKKKHIFPEEIACVGCKWYFSIFDLMRFKALKYLNLDNCCFQQYLCIIIIKNSAA